VGDLVVMRNFGLIRIDWSTAGPKVFVEIRGHDATPYATWRLYE